MNQNQPELRLLTVEGAESMNAPDQEPFQEWTAPLQANVYPVGWFSRLMWRFIRYRAPLPESVAIHTYGAGGGGGNSSTSGAEPGVPGELYGWSGPL